jgi:pimeloyl-ACP methyl ester carboxylesterase
VRSCAIALNHAAAHDEEPAGATVQPAVRRWPRRVLVGGLLALVVLWGVTQVIAASIAAHGEQFADPSEPPAAFGACWQHVTAPDVDGWWCPGRGAPIVFSHGYGGDREGLRKLSNTLHERTGRGILLPLLAYASGGEPFGGGEREGQTIAAALRWAAQETGERPVVFGFSVGGYAALRAVAAGAPVTGVIVDSSFLSSRDVFMFGATKVVPSPQWLWVGLPLAFPLVSGGGHLGEVDPGVVASWTAPTLAIRCRADATVPLAYQRELVERLHAQEWVGACDEHTGAYDANSQAYVDRVVAFLGP